MSKTSGWRRAAKVPFFIALFLYAGGAAFFYFQQDRMLFPVPSTYQATSPSDLGLAFDDLHISVNGSEQIHAWWIPASPPSDKVVLAFHGNGYVLDQCAGPRAGEVAAYRGTGANLLMVDYRGYGSSSPGLPNERRIFEDARAAFNYLTVQRKIPAHEIIFLGRSLGTGPATQLATEHSDAGGLILISPFTSIPDAAKILWYLRIFPLTLLSHSQFDNLERINSVHIPLLIAVGTNDPLTPPTMAEKLMQRANDPKRVYLAPGADHDHMIPLGGDALVAQMRSFIQTIP